MNLTALRRGSLLVLAALVVVGCAAPVRVEWSTETEMNTAGFNLYRSESPDGPFEVKVNDELIPPADDPLTGKQYTFVDQSALPGATYYYELQEVEKSGVINRFGPIRVTTSGLQWWHAVTLIGLAAVVLYLWTRGSKQLR